MLQPKRTRFRKTHRGRMKGLAQKGNSVAFGDFGLKALGASYEGLNPAALTVTVLYI